LLKRRLSVCVSVGLLTKVSEIITPRLRRFYSCIYSHSYGRALITNRNKKAKVIRQRLHRMCFPPRLGDRDPRLTQCVLGPKESLTNRISIRSAVFVHQSRVKPRDRQTDRQRRRQEHRYSNSLVCIPHAFDAA